MKQGNFKIENSFIAFKKLYFIWNFRFQVKRKGKRWRMSSEPASNLFECLLNSVLEAIQSLLEMLDHLLMGRGLQFSDQQFECPVLSLKDSAHIGMNGLHFLDVILQLLLQIGGSLYELLFALSGD